MAGGANHLFSVKLVSNRAESWALHWMQPGKSAIFFISVFEFFYPHLPALRKLSEKLQEYDPHRRRESYSVGMYVVLLHYTVPAEELNLLLPDHSNWINRHYRTHDFIAAGRRPSQTGAIIIARAMPRTKLDAILATDPLSLHHMVRADVINFRALRTIPELSQYADPLETSI